MPPQLPAAIVHRLAAASVPGADEWFSWLEDSLCWQNETLQLFGKVHQVPRQVAWCGEAGLCYRYSGRDHVCSGWPDKLVQLRDWAAAQFAIPFNFVLANRYRDGSDSMGWHADDEPELVADVCSVSFGAERRFLIEVAGERYGMTLDHGVAVLLPRQWRHALPKTKRPVGLRINLTFRQLRS